MKYFSSKRYQVRHFFASLIGVLLSLPGSATAQSIISNDVPGCDFASGDLDAGCIPSFLVHVIDQVFMVTGAICIIVIMIGGYQYALGNIVGGKEKGLATIRYGIIGMIVSALSFFIIDFIVSAIAGL